MYEWLTDTSRWPPRAICGEWTDPLILLHRGSGLTVAICYTLIPVLVMILYAQWRAKYRIWSEARTGAPPMAVRHMGTGVTLSGLFVSTCGATHLTGDWMLFVYPAYNLHGVVLASCAIASLSCVFWLAWEVWKALTQ